MDSTTIAEIANIALALSFIVGLIFGIAQVHAAARDRKERLTLTTLRNFQTREFCELMLAVNSNDLPGTQADMRKLPEVEQVRYLQFLQEMESLGILVSEKLINIELVDKTLGSFVISSWEKFMPLVLEIRPRDPFLCEYFQWLSEQLKERMELQPRKPFNETNAKP